MRWDTEIFNLYKALITIKKTITQKNYISYVLDEILMRATFLRDDGRIPLPAGRLARKSEQPAVVEGGEEQDVEVDFGARSG